MESDRSLRLTRFIKEFLIEPATPPHDPNFEYDLLSDLMLENAHHMGRAGVANSKYNSYIIPKLDWGDGWDDSFSGYTGGICCLPWYLRPYYRKFRKEMKNPTKQVAMLS